MDADVEKYKKQFVIFAREMEDFLHSSRKSANPVHKSYWRKLQELNHMLECREYVECRDSRGVYRHFMLPRSLFNCGCVCNCGYAFRSSHGFRFYVRPYIEYTVEI